MTTPIFIRDLLWETGAGVDAAAEIDTRPPSIPSEEAWVQALQIPTGEPPFAPPLDPNAPPTGVVQRILMDLVPQTPGDFTRLVRAGTQTAVPPPPTFAPATFRHIPGSWTRDGFYAPQLTTALGGPIDARLWTMSRTAEVVYLPGGLPAGHAGLIRLSYYRYVGATGGGGGGGGGLVFGDSGSVTGTSILDQSSAPPDTIAVFRKLVGDGIDIELAGTSGQERLVFANLGVRSITAGTGIGASTSSGVVTLASTYAVASSSAAGEPLLDSGSTAEQTRLKRIAAGPAGLSVATSGGPGSELLTIANTGVTSLLVGDGITISGGTGAVTVTNSGVRSLTSPAVTNPAGAQSLIQTGSTANAVVLRQLVAGPGILLSSGSATTPSTSEIITIEATGTAAQWQYVANGPPLIPTTSLVPILPGGSSSDNVSLVFGTESSVVKDDPQGEGRRLQFTTADGAFRAGEVTDNGGAGTWWDIRGVCSVAMGQDNLVGADYSSVTGGSRNLINTEYSVIGGGRFNLVASNYSFIGGGGSTTATDRNEISGNSLLSFIGGGFKNRIQSDGLILDADGRGACIVGGIDNSIGGSTTTRIAGNFIGGGNKNSITQASSNNVIAGGQENTVSGAIGSVICGGGYGAISNNSDYGFIGGGGGALVADRNGISIAANGVVCGGRGNSLSGLSFFNPVTSTIQLAPSSFSLVAGGQSNSISGSEHCFIGGGGSNAVVAVSGTIDPVTGSTPVFTSEFASIVSGQSNLITSASHSVIGGGRGHHINAASFAAVLGGDDNDITGSDVAIICGGIENRINGSASLSSAIVGGRRNVVGTSRSAFIGGGEDNNVDATSTYSAVAGGKFNRIGNTGLSATFGFIGGGGGADAATGNAILGASYGFIGGGRSHRVQQAVYSAVVCGDGNVINAAGNSHFIGGGSANRIRSKALVPGIGHNVIVSGFSNQVGNEFTETSVFNSIGGGTHNAIAVLPAPDVLDPLVPRASAEGCVISGGRYNTIEGDASFCFIGGGGTTDPLSAPIVLGNRIVSSVRSTIVGGGSNRIEKGNRCFVGGGLSNVVDATGDGHTIVAGTSNQILSDAAALGVGHNSILAGFTNQIGNAATTTSLFNTIGAGANNSIAADAVGSSQSCAIVGGRYNQITGASNFSFIGGGGGNTEVSDRNRIIGSSNAVIVGGGSNTIQTGSNHSSILGGQSNTITSSAQCSIMGGSGNSIGSASGGTVIGNICAITAGGSESIAMGRSVSLSHPNCFVWSGLTSLAAYNADQANQVRFRAQGGFVIHTSDDLSTGIKIDGGSSSWGAVCDRHKKDLEGEVDPLRVLAGVETLPLYYWTYKGNNDKSRKNLGPTAQDWQERFPLGRTELMIDTLEFDGVALSAIKGVAQLVRGLEARADAAEARAAAMVARANEAEARAAAMEARLAALEARFAPQ